MRRLSNITRLTARGDTIVEVLLAIAIVTTVLGGAFLSVNRSFTAGRQSQERGEAIKYAQEQLEKLKQAVKDPSKNIFGTGPTPYCLNDALNRVATTDPACNLGPDGRYKISMTRDTSTNTFTSVVEWDRLGGGTPARDRVIVSYRVYDR